MSDDRRTTHDLSDLPFVSEAERAEYEWLLARETDPAAPPPSAKVASDYARLESLLGSLPVDPDDSWHDEVLRRATAAPAPTPWWRRTPARWTLASGGVVAAAAVIALVVRSAPRPADDPGLAATRELWLEGGDRVRGDQAAPSQDNLIGSLGQHLHSRPHPSGFGDVRVYRPDRTLAARCPGGPGCVATAEGDHVELVLDHLGVYYLFTTPGGTGLPVELDLDSYIQAANDRHLAHVRRSIDVQ